MKVILLTEIKGKGGEGDVVDVARGFANNYLIPQKKAVLATKGNLKQLDMRRANIAKREEARIADAEALKAKLSGLTVKVDARVGEEGQLFGSVTAAMVADALKAQEDIDVDRKRIELTKPIRTAGKHEVEISLYRAIKATVAVQVGDVPEPAAEETESEEEAAAVAVADAEETAEEEAAE
jgi:large subunit ribosomal protein L9